MPRSKDSALSILALCAARQPITDSTEPSSGEMWRLFCGFKRRILMLGGEQDGEKLFGSDGVGDDVDSPAGQLGSEPRILAFLADGQGELIIGHNHAG